MIILLFVSVNSLEQRKAVVYGNYLPLGRRLSYPRPEIFGYNGVSYRKVWENEAAVFEGESWRHLFVYDFIGNLIEAYCGN